MLQFSILSLNAVFLNLYLSVYFCRVAKMNLGGMLVKLYRLNL